MFRTDTSLRLVSLILLATVLLASASGQTNYATPYAFSTLAGTSSIGSNDGPGSTARFNNPSGVAADGAGNLYIADTNNQVIRKITPAGLVSTLAGAAGEPGSNDGAGNTARFGFPKALTVDASGNIFVADSGNYTIRKITPDGVVSTWVKFGYIYGIAAGPAGDICALDTYSVRKITMQGVVSFFAGSKSGERGSADGAAANARFESPEGIASDATGLSYVADTVNNIIRKILPDGTVTTIAGMPGVPGTADGAGNSARFHYPKGVAVDSVGNIYVSDTNQFISPQIHKIRKITPAGIVTTIAGGEGDNLSTDGTGSAARFNKPKGLAADAAGNIYVADSGNNAIRKISAGGAVTTVAGLGLSATQGTANGTGSTARFGSYSYGVAVAPNGDVYVADTTSHTVRKCTPAGEVSTFAGSPGSPGNADGTGAAARFNLPSGLAVDGSGNVFVADYGNGAVRKITPAGSVSTVAAFVTPRSVAVDGGGNLYVASNDMVWKVPPSGPSVVLSRQFTIPASAQASWPFQPFFFVEGLAVDAAGNVYLADTGSGLIEKITPAGDTTIFAGWYSGRDTAPVLIRPTGLAIDKAGNLFVTEPDSATVRRIDPAGNVTNVAGVYRQPGRADGLGRDVRFSNPIGIATDGNGALYVMDGATLVKGQLPRAPSITTQPQSASVTTGGGVQFSVTTTGAPDPTHQWYYNGNPFSGATSSTLSFTNAKSADAGDYTVVVTNAMGSVTSAKATLTVTAAPPPSAGGGGNSGGGGGGGAIEDWFVLALVALGAARQIVEAWKARPKAN